MSQPIPGQVESFELTPAQAPRVPFGLSSLIALVGAVGAVLAGVDGNDPALVVGSVAAIVGMVGRFAQAITLARTVARAALPYVQAVAELDDPQ